MNRTCMDARNDKENVGIFVALSPFEIRFHGTKQFITVVSKSRSYYS